jgi:hypothetical protein
VRTHPCSSPVVLARCFVLQLCSLGYLAAACGDVASVWSMVYAVEDRAGSRCSNGSLLEGAAGGRQGRGMTTPLQSRGFAGKPDEEADSIRLRVRLMRETGCGEAEVGIAVGRALERFRDARIREFVGLLAERDARRQLRAWPPDLMTAIELDARRPEPDE